MYVTCDLRPLPYLKAMASHHHPMGHMSLSPGLMGVAGVIFHMKNTSIWARFLVGLVGSVRFG